MSVGIERIRELMLEHNETQVKLAQAIGVSPSTVNRMLKQKTIPQQYLAIIAEHYNVPIEELQSASEDDNRNIKQLQRELEKLRSSFLSLLRAAYISNVGGLYKGILRDAIPGLDIAESPLMLMSKLAEPEEQPVSPRSVLQTFPRTETPAEKPSITEALQVVVRDLVNAAVHYEGRIDRLLRYIEDWFPATSSRIGTNISLLLPVIVRNNKIISRITGSELQDTAEVKALLQAFEQRLDEKQLAIQLISRKCVEKEIVCLRPTITAGASVNVAAVLSELLFEYGRRAGSEMSISVGPAGTTEREIDLAIEAIEHIGYKNVERLICDLSQIVPGRMEDTSDLLKETLKLVDQATLSKLPTEKLHDIMKFALERLPEQRRSSDMQGLFGCEMVLNGEPVSNPTFAPLVTAMKEVFPGSKIIFVCQAFKIIDQVDNQELIGESKVIPSDCVDLIVTEFETHGPDSNGHFNLSSSIEEYQQEIREIHEKILSKAKHK
jgi:transcriptional regulator with XRE-family HTH domain